MLLLCASLAPGTGFAQAMPEAGTGASRTESAVFLPMLVDPDRRMERPAQALPSPLRFLTTEDYPPFHYIGANGALSGFNIDLANAICQELSILCTVQPRAWPGLLPALDAGAGDAVIASHRIDRALRRSHALSFPIHRAPARFVARQGAAPDPDSPASLAGRSVAVVGGSAHEAFLNAHFPTLRLARFPTQERALEAMRRAQADLAFGDGASISFWLNGSESLGCCRFVGGPYLESRYFGEGAAIVMRKGDRALRGAIDYALWRIFRDGRYARLYLKHFPVPFY